ncbi:hypothetical protein BUZ34_02945, partial [Staphylococcus haemolyticus]
MKENEMYNSFINSYKRQTQNYDFLGEDINSAFPLLKFENYLNYIFFKVPNDIFSQNCYMVVVDNTKDIESYIEVSKADLNKYYRDIMENEKHNRFEVFIQK